MVAGDLRHPLARAALLDARSEEHTCDRERAGSVAFLIRHRRQKYALRVRYCSRARLGLYPCGLPSFCRPCTGFAKLQYEDRVMALCALALSDNPKVVFLAGDFTVGETKSARKGVRLVKTLLSSIQESGAKAWARIVGVLYSIEIGKSRTGRWWVHAHTFLALDTRDQPPTRQALAKEWAWEARLRRWPDEEVGRRSESDKRYKKLLKSQKVKPLYLYTRMGMGVRLQPVPSKAALEPDLRARARYLRERNGEPGHERILALTRLADEDRLAIIDLRERLNGRTGMFRNHKEPEVRALAAQLRARRLEDLSRRRLDSHAPIVNARRPHPGVVRVRPSSSGFRSRLRAHFEGQP